MYGSIFPVWYESAFGRCANGAFCNLSTYLENILGFDIHFYSANYFEDKLTFSNKSGNAASLFD